MRQRAKWISVGAGAVVVSATISFLGLWPVLPRSAVQTCETAFGEEVPVPASLTTKQQEDAWAEAQDQAQQRALAQTGQLVAQPGMVAMMRTDLIMNKRDAWRYASIAYVLGYYGIDTVTNVRRLRGMLDADPSEPLTERLAMIADPSATDDIVDGIPDRVFDICEHHPTPAVLRAALSWRADTSTEETIVESTDDLFVSHPNEVMAAIAGRRDLEDNVAMALGGMVAGDPRLVPIISQECGSPDARIRSAALYCRGAMKRWET